MNKWVMRTVRNGKVKVGGKFYEPRDPHVPYNGELEGLRFMFGRYFVGNKVEPFISLWGTEALAILDDPETVEWDNEMAKQPNIIDGIIHWQWWRTN